MRSRACGGWGSLLLWLYKIMAILIHLLLLLPLLGYACRVDLDCASGRCLRRGDGQYECSCPAGYRGEGCEQVVTFKRSATTETSPCLCSDAGDCTNNTTSDSPCIPSQDRPGKCNSLTNIELRWYYPFYFLPGDGGCTGGKDVWGFVWPNAGNDETVAVPYPDGQGGLRTPHHLLLSLTTCNYDHNPYAESATRVCINGVWQMAQVLQCDSAGFVEALTKVKCDSMYIFHMQII